MERPVKNNMARMMAALFAVAISVCFLSQTGVPAYADSESENPAMSLGADVLSQSVNTSDAQTVYYADISWRVIGYDGEGAASVSGAATLLASDKQGTTKFDDDTTDKPVHYYSESYLKKRIDGDSDCILAGFSDSEKEAIEKKTLKCGKYNGSNTDCIRNTTDLTDVSLWPLTTKEAGSLNAGLRTVGNWWLGSPGDVTYREAFADNSYVRDSGQNVGKTAGVRPAFNLKTDSILFASSAEGGKASNDEGADALKAQSDLTNSTSEWKTTVTDSNHESFSVVSVVSAENGVSVKYSNAATGDNEYISAIITDKSIDESDATVKYYGRIQSCPSDEYASGTVTINTEGKLGENDKLYIFSEQCNGDKKTDFASPLTAVDVQDSTESNEEISMATVSGIEDKTWTGKSLKQNLTVNLSGKTLKEGTDYAVVYEDNKDVGKVTLSIAGKGDYTGTITKTFRINPKGASIVKLAKGKKAITVKWKKQAKKMPKSRITGYQVQLATDKNFTKNKKTVTVKGYAKTSKKVTNLKAKKKYYVRVRTYMSVGGKKYYSTWSKAKSITTE